MGQAWCLGDGGGGGTSARMSGAGARVDAERARLAHAINCLDRGVRVLNDKYTHLLDQQALARRAAARARRQQDLPRARHHTRAHMLQTRAAASLMRMMDLLTALKLQVQMTSAVEEALGAISQYAAIGTYIDQLTRDYDVDALVAQIQENSERLGALQDTLAEPAPLPDGYAMAEDEVDAALERLARDEDARVLAAEYTAAAPPPPGAGAPDRPLGRIVSDAWTSILDAVRPAGAADRRPLLRDAPAADGGGAGDDEADLIPLPQ